MALLDIGNCGRGPDQVRGIRPKLPWAILLRDSSFVNVPCRCVRCHDGRCEQRPSALSLGAHAREGGGIKASRRAIRVPRAFDAVFLLGPRCARQPVRTGGHRRNECRDTGRVERMTAHSGPLRHASRRRSGVPRARMKLRMVASTSPTKFYKKGNGPRARRRPASNRGASKLGNEVAVCTRIIAVSKPAAMHNLAIVNSFNVLDLPVLTSVCGTTENMGQLCCSSIFLATRARVRISPSQLLVSGKHSSN